MDYEEMLEQLRKYLNDLEPTARLDTSAALRATIGRDPVEREIDAARELVVEALKSYLRTRKGREKFMELAMSWGK